MVRFSVWPTSNANEAFNHAIDAWRQDRDLRTTFGACFRIRPTYTPGARMFHKIVPLGELSIAATAATSPLVHDCIPAPPDPDPRFFLLMPNKPRYVHIGAQQFVQQSGECVIADSTVGHTAAYKHPHGAICLIIPGTTLRNYIPNPEHLVGMRFPCDQTLSRLLPRLLHAVWMSADRNAGCSEARLGAQAILRVMASCYARSCAPDNGCATINCEQIKRLVDHEIRNPALSVQLVAAKMGVTPRYLQLLFAKEQECVSQYIKRQRLLGCLIDLGDADCQDQSITEIAFSWGFNSAAHFSSSFKKEFGLNPRTYRACGARDLGSVLSSGTDGALVQAALLLGRYQDEPKGPARQSFAAC